MSFGQEERNAVLRVIERGILSGYQGNYSEAFWGGPEVQALEAQWSAYFNVKHAISVNSATSGLWAACAAVGLQPGDEVLCSPYSMTCSASIPLQFGAKPVFCDIEENYFCIDPISIESRITDRTRAIIAVDLFGLPANYDAINAIAKKYNLKVIEDAAQAIGATYKGKYAGTLADVGVYSLNRHKHINCGEGGIIVTDDDDLAMKARLCINHSEAVINDMSRKDIDITAYHSLWPGMNLRMTELSAAVAREQLKKLNWILQKVRGFADWFPDIKVRPECNPAYYRYAFTADMPEEYTTPLDNPWFHHKRHYITPILHMPLFKQLGYDQESCPICDEVDGKIVLAWLKGMG